GGARARPLRQLPLLALQHQHRQAHAADVPGGAAGHQGASRPDVSCEMRVGEGRPPDASPNVEWEDEMSKPQPIEHAQASRKVRDVNNFWKYLANDPALLERTWKSLKDVMAPGALDPLTKEMIYLAVSVTNGCGYCTASHGAAARKAGMTEAMFGELMGVV